MTMLLSDTIMVGGGAWQVVALTRNNLRPDAPPHGMEDRSGNKTHGLLTTK